MKNSYDDLEKKIGYEFSDNSRLDVAFTHKSYTNEKMCGSHPSYERYEFLGDAILEYVVSDYLFANYPDLTEGELTKLRASLVCEFTLSKISTELGLGDYGLFSKGELKCGGNKRSSILCDLFESLVGAIYLDGGIKPAKDFIYKILLTDIEHKKLFHDSKTRLQEYSQKSGRKLQYILMEETGPEHDKNFHVKAELDGFAPAEGHGHSRKNAEQEAAYKLLCSVMKNN